jgi:hypothetical protein
MTVRTGIIALAAGVAVSTGVGAARAIGPQPPGAVATATVSPATAGTKRVALTIRFHAELQCGLLNASRLAVRLPGAMRVPASIDRSSLAVSGKEPARVTVTSRATVLISPARPRVSCDVLAPGMVVIGFARSSDLTNPARPGTYAFSVTASRRVWRGTFRITY